MHLPLELASAWLSHRCETHKCDYKECGASDELAVLGMTTTLGAAAGSFVWRRQGAVVGWLAGLGVGMWINYLADYVPTEDPVGEATSRAFLSVSPPELSNLARMARRFAAARRKAAIHVRPRPVHCVVAPDPHMSPVTVPSARRSMFCAAGDFPSPGILTTSPAITTRKPAPADG